MSKSPVAADWLDDRPAFSARPGTPVHVQIERWLTGVMSNGGLVSGDRLPREDDLATALGVSRMTLRQALSTLESLGTVTRVKGRSGGTFVSEPRVECDLTGLAGFTEQMRRANLRAGARLVSARQIRGSAAVTQALGLDRGADVYEVVRIRTARREPLALERSYFPAHLCPDLIEQRLTGSIYELLARVYGLRPRTAKEVLEPVVATDAEAAHLQVEAGAPLMLIERTAFTSAGVAVEHSKDLFRPDRVRISLMTGIGSEQPAARSSVAALP